MKVLNLMLLPTQWEFDAKFSTRKSIIDHILKSVMKGFRQAFKKPSIQSKVEVRFIHILPFH